MAWYLSARCEVDDREIIKRLEGIGKKCVPLLRKAIRPLANEVKKRVKPLAPKRTGALRKSITVVPIRSRRFYTVGFRVFGRYVKAAGDEDGKFYAFAPEYGVRDGKGQQIQHAFFRNGARIAEGYIPRCKEAIAAAIVAAYGR